jgi:hypothetical protein
MSEESAMVKVWDGDELVGLHISQPTASSPSPTAEESELVRIFDERKYFQSQLTTANAEVDKLTARVKVLEGAVAETKKHSLAFVECKAAGCKCGPMIQIGMFADAILKPKPSKAVSE